jgi:meso-butanediol dehydrogenase / (S,S)-butanediol dehydrogenase / diacetyl reductase
VKLARKVALVTGAAAGIGRATSILFAREGASIVAVDVDAPGLDALVTEIAFLGGQAKAVVADVSRSSDVDAAVSSAIGSFGRIDILFNNAGFVPSGKLHETTESDWDQSMAVGVKSVYLFSRRVITVLQKQGGGAILNMSSAVALRSLPNRAAYAAAKGAILTLTRAMALDYVQDNIRVNCLCPGTIDTPSLRERLRAQGDLETVRKQFAARQPMGRLGTAEEIAASALYLVSDDASFVTGVAFSIDGGLSL